MRHFLLIGLTVLPAVLVGGCGSGRTTVLRQLRERIGRTAVQYIDVERTATTPERFRHAVTSVSPFPVSDPTTQGAVGARAAFDATLAFLTRARTPASEPATFLLDEFLELRTFESFPGLRRVLHDGVGGRLTIIGGERNIAFAAIEHPDAFGIMDAAVLFLAPERIRCLAERLTREPGFAFVGKPFCIRKCLIDNVAEIPLCPSAGDPAHK